MSKSWGGPTMELTATRADPLYHAIVRHSGKQGIFFDTDQTGKSADAFTIEKSRGDWFRMELERFVGGNAYSVALSIARAFTDLDADLMALHTQYINRLAEEVASDLRSIVGNVYKLTYEIEDLIASVRT